MSSTCTSKFNVYLDFQKTIRGVKLPINIKYLNLVRYVKHKFNIKAKSITLHYRSGFTNVVVNDDDDVEFFVTEKCCKEKGVQTLFISVIQTPDEVNKANSSHVNDFDLNLPVKEEETSNETPHNEQHKSVREEGIDDDHVEPNSKKCRFDNIPSPPRAPDAVIKKPKSRNNISGCPVKKGDRFDHKAACVTAIGKMAIAEGFEYKVVKSCKTRYSVRCVQEECRWHVHARKRLSNRKFYVTNICTIHSCPRNQINPNHRNANQKLVGHIIVEKLKDCKRVYSPKAIQKDFNLEFKVDISYKRAWGARNKAAEMVSGCPKESFAKLPRYCYNLKLANEGTVTHIKTDDDHRFEILFIGFGVAIRSFKRDMRPLIIIDAAHLKGRYLGTNLLAVGMDGNNQIIPIATGVCQGETNESWSWFMTKLKECIGEDPNLAIISDRHHAISQACKTVFPNAFHGYCCRHLMMNCKLKTDKFKAIFWRTCKCYTVESFNKSIFEIMEERPEAYTLLEEVGFEKWSRAHCPANRYNYMTSNSAESINALTRDVRHVPITSLMEFYRKLLQSWYYDRREKYQDAKKDDLTDWAAAKVADRMQKSAHWVVNGIEQHKLYQVTEAHHIHIVDFDKRECTCRKWQISGIPCGHVCAVSRVEKMNNNNIWTLRWFKKTTLKSTYRERVYPLPDESQWQTCEDIQLVEPPYIVKRQSGRPKKNDRYPSQGEEPQRNVCGRCGNHGHTRKTCKAPLPQKQKRKRQNQSATPTQEHDVEQNRNERRQRGRESSNVESETSNQIPFATNNSQQSNCSSDFNWINLDDL